MDDFGIDYFNLSYLMENPFDYRKIDRSFVAKIGEDKKYEELVNATISIAKALSLKTVGE